MIFNCATLVIFLSLLFNVNIGHAYIDDNGIPYNSNLASFIAMPDDSEHNYSKEDFSFGTTKKVDIHDISIPFCQDIVLAFDLCSPMICKIETSFGISYHKIAGLSSSGLCTYMERMPALGGIDCSIPKFALKKVGNALYKKMQWTDVNANATLSDEEVGDIYNLEHSYCTMLFDQNLSEIITIDTPNGYNSNTTNAPIEQKKEIHTAKNEPIQPIYNEDIIIQTTKKIDNPFKKRTQRYEGSVMLYQQDLTNVKEAIRALKSGSKSSSGDTGSAQLSERLTLNSIMYISKDLWTIWLNGKKLSSNDEGKYENIEIYDVTADYISFGVVVKNPSNLIKSLSNAKAAQEADMVEAHQIGEGIYRITVKLRINQTLSISEMNITEGKQAVH